MKEEQRSLWEISVSLRASLVVQLVKNLPAMQEAETKVHSLGQKDPPGEGNNYPLQYSGLENSMDCIVRGVAKSRTRLSHFHFHLCEVWLFLCSFNLFFHRPPNQNFCFSDRIMY